ncbi:ankyrin repeat domain-containing protein 1 [Plakobranchus ocellatus]|uniref:Ankyrin repeat domain-containing protein 1 n=1 Tax=Plakobranchus ocellatus TaxID=259542 RepID=A0AAV3X8L3_9GAST|nr:ankyrin repeat domain-containing protein 1 [Plakobranchus ocellatus]
MAADSSGQMYFAVTDNDPARLQELIRSGGDVDQFYEDVTNISTKSLLHVCCGRGHVQCLRILIENGAKLDVRDDWGQTPLMYSVSIQFPEAAQVLLEAEPELINCQDRFGKSPLHCAVSAGSEELVRLLLRFGADVNVRCHEGLTPLMCCSMADPEGLKVKLMEVLMEAGCLIDLMDYRGRRTALHIAVSAGNVPAVEKLISAGADVNCIEKTLRTPLTLAITAGMKGGLVNEASAQIVSLLVSAGAKLDVCVNESCNPLMTSALLKSEPAVRYFLSLGANPNVKCSVYKRRRRVEYLLDPFELAYMEGYFDLCKLMVQAGYSVHRLRQCFLRDFLKETTSSDAAIRTVPEPRNPNAGSGLLGAAETPNDMTLTLEHAQRLPDDWRDILQWLITKASNARSLREESMFAVRSIIGYRLLNCIDHLPVPKLVKQHLMLGHLGLDEPVFSSSFLNN